MTRLRALFCVASCLLSSSPLLATTSTLWVDATAPLGGDGSSTSPFRSVRDAIDVAVIGVAGPQSTTLHGNRDGPVAFLGNGSPVLEGFTIENGSGGSVPGIWVPCGGGILIYGSTYAVVPKCIVRGNYAARGDGVAAVSAAGVMHSSVIEWNGGYSDPSFFNSEALGRAVVEVGILEVRWRSISPRIERPVCPNTSCWAQCPRLGLAASGSPLVVMVLGMTFAVKFIRSVNTNEGTLDSYSDRATDGWGCGRLGVITWGHCCESF